MAGYLDPTASSQPPPEAGSSVSPVESDLTPILPAKSSTSIPVKVLLYLLLLFKPIDELLLIRIFTFFRKKNHWSLATC